MNTGKEFSEYNDGIILTLIKGGLVGIANIIPGVSGGTFALILGIFPRLINALNSLGIRTIRILFGSLIRLFRGQAGRSFMDEWRRIDAAFLLLLAAGALSAILSTSFLIDFLLREHHSVTLAFFIGLILPSIAIPWSMLDRRGMVLLWAIPGILFTVGISLIMPENAAGSDSLLIAVIIGAIAISAMILPGLSGSYVMLIMGQYQNLIDKLIGMQKGFVQMHIETATIIWLVALLAGMIAGVILFAKFLNFLLRRFKNATIMFLIGLLIGSLWILWPFKDIGSGASITNSHGEVKQEVKIATARNRLPNSFSESVPVVLVFLVGIAGSSGVIALGKRLEKKA